MLEKYLKQTESYNKVSFKLLNSKTTVVAYSWQHTNMQNQGITKISKENITSMLWCLLLHFQ